ncbi:MAG: deoxyribodipyrimidine photo-lyase [Pseudomonadota bacterium]
MSQKNVNILWFKRDLRLHDHAPLVEAAANGVVLPLYIVEPDYWRLPDSSRRHWHFIHDSLQDLSSELSMHGAMLAIRIGNAITIFNTLLQQYKHITLWSHEETGNDWTYRRDKQVKIWCDTNNVKWFELPSNGVVRRLKNRNEWSKIRNQRMQQPILVAPQSIKIPDYPISDDLPAKHHAMFCDLAIGNVQKAGRTEGLKVLDSFLSERGRKYMLNISKPGISARHCSRLSPHIAFGTLSVREIEQATKSKIAYLTT